MSKYHSSKVFGDAVGPFGFPMPDKLAKAADEALKKLPKEVRERFKTTVIDANGNRVQVEGYARRMTETKAMDFRDGEHADISVITSDTVDRDKEVVLPRGLDFSQFLKNPVVTFCHNYSTLPVGKCLWVKMESISDGDCWKAKTLYTPRPNEALLPKEKEFLPDIVWHYVREGFMPGKSIGFIPLSYRDFTPDEIRANPKWADATWGVVPEALILEYAVCPVQANPDALVENVAKMRAKGITSKSMTDALGLIVPEVIPPMAEEAIPKQIEEPEIKSFVRPETIRDAAQRRALASLKGLPSKVESRIVDRLHREMGKV